MSMAKHQIILIGLLVGTMIFVVTACGETKYVCPDGSIVANSQDCPMKKFVETKRFSAKVEGAWPCGPSSEMCKREMVKQFGITESECYATGCLYDEGYSYLDCECEHN